MTDTPIYYYNKQRMDGIFDMEIELIAGKLYERGKSLKVFQANSLKNEMVAMVDKNPVTTEQEFMHQVYTAAQTVGNRF